MSKILPVLPPATCLLERRARPAAAVFCLAAPGTSCAWISLRFRGELRLFSAPRGKTTFTRSVMLLARRRAHLRSTLYAWRHRAVFRHENCPVLTVNPVGFDSARRQTIFTRL
jgi:hypothetical protein